MTTPTASTAPVLTIAVPTYNRSRYLEQCLSTILPQARAAGGRIAVLVIDNASTDETPDVLASFAAEYPDVLATKRNPVNIGGDANIAKCFEACETRHAWVFGDDDDLAPTALGTVLDLLQAHDPGVIYLKPQPYKGDASAVFKAKGAGRYARFTRRTLGAMLYEVSDMFSFISGNVVRKASVPSGLDLYKHVKTHYNQVQWVFAALFAADVNIIADDHLLAINDEGNSGGYPFCRVFGTNLNILFDECVRYGARRADFDVINKRMARELFPGLIYQCRISNGTYRNYVPEDYYAELKPSYGRYWEFWFLIMPMCKLPKAILYPHFLAVRILNRLYRPFHKPSR